MLAMGIWWKIYGHRRIGYGYSMRKKGLLHSKLIRMLSYAILQSHNWWWSSQQWPLHVTRWTCRITSMQKWSIRTTNSYFRATNWRAEVTHMLRQGSKLSEMEVVALYKTHMWGVRATPVEWLKLILVTHFLSLFTQNVVSTPAAPTK